MLAFLLLTGSALSYEGPSNKNEGKSAGIGLFLADSGLPDTTLLSSFGITPWITYNNNTVILDNGCRQVRFPILNIIFSNEDLERFPADSQAAKVRDILGTITRYYRENSWGKLEMNFRLRTAMMDRPRRYRGNEKDTAVYDIAGNLVNPGDFMQSRNYTGFDAFIVPQRVGGEAKFGGIGGNGANRSLVMSGEIDTTGVSWGAVVAGDFLGGGYTDLLFYDPSQPRAVAEVCSTHSDDHLHLVRRHTGWRSSWTLLIPGNFDGDADTDLACYDANAGEIEFLSSDGRGGFDSITTYRNCRTSWSIIVPGHFTGSDYTDLLFYDPTTGEAQLDSIRGDARMHRVTVFDNWRRTWSIITAGELNGDGIDDLVFYDRSANQIELWNQSGIGRFDRLGWKYGLLDTLDTILTGDFGSGAGIDDLMLFARRARRIWLYSTDGSGSFDRINYHHGVPIWTFIVPGQFRGGQRTDFLFCDCFKGDGSWERNYNAKSEYNFAEEGLKTAEVQSHLYDDRITFQDWLDYGIPGGSSNASIGYLSASMCAGGARNYGTWLGPKAAGDPEHHLGIPLVFGTRTMHEYAFGDFSWELMAHELGHKLGTIDRYYQNDPKGFLPYMNIMGYHWEGSHFDALMKFRFGWLEPRVLRPSRVRRTVRIPPIYSDPHNATLIRPDEGDPYDEFFLLEVRYKDSTNPPARWDGRPVEFDRKFVETDNRAGVLIYHVNGEGHTGTEPIIKYKGDNVGRGFHVGDTLSADSTLFYDNTRSGLSAAVLDRDPYGTHFVELGWEFNQGEAEFHTFDAEGNVSRLNTLPNWDADCDIIVPGRFDPDNTTDLLSYQPRQGWARVYQIDGAGIRNLRTLDTNWRKTWDIIVPGQFNEDGFTDVLCYDAVAGEAEIKVSDREFGFSTMKEYTNWPRTIDIIVPGRFFPSGWGLLVYDAYRGEAEFWRIRADGEIERTRQHTGWRKTWSIIVTAQISEGDYSDLIFYDPWEGEAEYHRTNGDGTTTRIERYTGWRKTWDAIVPCGFFGRDLLLYDPTQGHAEIHRLEPNGEMKRLNRYTDWRKSWDIILPMTYYQWGFNFGFFLYDHSLR